MYFCFVDGGRLVPLEGPEERFPQGPHQTVFFGCGECGRVFRLDQGRFWGEVRGMRVIESWTFDPQTRLAQKI